MVISYIIKIKSYTSKYPKKSLDNPDDVASRSHLDEWVPLCDALHQILRAGIPAVDVPDDLPLLIVHEHGHRVSSLHPREPAVLRGFDELEELPVVDFAVFAVEVVDLLAVAVDALLLPLVLRDQSNPDHAEEGLHHFDFQVVDSAFGDGLLAVDHQFLVGPLPDLQGAFVGLEVEVVLEVAYLLVDLKAEEVGVLLEDVHAPFLLHQFVHVQVDDLLLDLLIRSRQQVYLLALLHHHLLQFQQLTDHLPLLVLQLPYAEAQLLQLGVQNEEGHGQQHDDGE